MNAWEPEEEFGPGVDTERCGTSRGMRLRVTFSSVMEVNWSKSKEER